MKLAAKLHLLLDTLLVTSLSAAAHAGAAYVADFDHRSAAYHIERQGHAAPVRFNLPLQNGDRVYVDEPGATLVIRYSDKKKTTATYGPPVTVDGARNVATSRSNTSDLIWQRATDSHNHRVTTGTKGDDGPLALLLPGLRDGTARIAAGERHLMLGWSGGVGPYAVTLRNADGTVYETTNKLRNLIVFSHPLVFKPGRYDIEISDHGNSTVRGSFTVVSEGIPKPAARADDAVDQSISDAAELAASGDRSLYFEAYLRLFDAINTPDKQGDPRARVLALWISDGAAE